MHKKLTLSIAMAVVGAGLLVGSSFAGATSASAPTKSGSSEVKRGGTLRINASNTDFEFTDPAMAYDVLGWQMLYSTNMFLMNYPDKPAPEGSRLFPEAAAGFPRVSKDGKTYTFTIRSGIKFSDGSPL
ncbi:MAG TPA: ABC transporter substrate-binding protein, partial [Gaiellaceae bacterium]|nr:ABC transporter substrate-binding protein [Gaiellaceae bacterium]